MAPRKTRTDGADPSSDGALRTKYAELARKYAGVVSSLEEPRTERLRREQELMRTREALLQKEHLRVIGELTASVSHEVGSTLRGMAARVTVLSTDPHIVRRHHDVLHGLMESIHATQRDLRRLLAAARAGSLTAAPV